MIASLKAGTRIREERGGVSVGGQQRQSAFTRTDLLALIVVLVALGSLALANPGSDEHVLRAQCASNLRQIGVALNRYAAENDDYLPVCGWPEGQNPWHTYEVGRVVPGTSTMTRGFMSLGLLVRTEVLPDAKPLYCPAQTLPAFTYDYYSTTPSGWPSTPAGSGDDNIRTGYNYYPQPRVTQDVGLGLLLPKLDYTSQMLEFGGNFSLMTPAKLTQVNPRKSITTDLVHSISVWSHQALGSVAGLNALFPDGAVVFQNARTGPEEFHPAVWLNIGANNTQFRRIMSNWEQ